VSANFFPGGNFCAGYDLSELSEAKPADLSSHWEESGNNGPMVSLRTEFAFRILKINPLPEETYSSVVASSNFKKALQQGVSVDTCHN
jgi:hypothetical protein